MKKLNVETELGNFTIPVKWLGTALAVHRPIVGFGGKLSDEKCYWTITHIESGKSAGTYNGPMHEAIKLAKAWDQIYKEDFPGPTPDTRGWVLVKHWYRQLNKLDPIGTPDRFEAVINTYAQD